jgi:NAD(P)-dependent dehydrogenase (short-subunit alcohol dehydrogenase family)
MHVIITGAASGIGRGGALRLGRRMKVVVADRDLAGARRVASEIEAAGGQALGVEVDVTSRASVQEMVASARKAFGPVDALFANAGVNRRNPIDQISESDWDLMMATHVKGVFLSCQSVLGEMVERGKGAIVNTSSDFAIMGVAGNAAYTSAKTAIYSLTKAIATEFTPRGIRVNAIGPGPIDTPLLASGRSDEQHAALKQKFAAALPLGRMGRPEDVAVVVDFLLSDRASYISGQIFHPNGGQLMW